EGPFPGSDWGSKRRREGKEPESASTPSEPATRSVAGLQQGLNLDRRQQVSLLLQRSLCRLPLRWKSPHTWSLKQQADSRSSFNELLDTPLDFSNFIMNWLRVDTLTPELLAGPTFELMKGSYNSLIELEYHLEEVYKATTDQLDWVNPEGQHDGTLNDVRTALDDRLKGISICHSQSGKEMASLLAKRVASNLLRVRTIASSSCIFSCQGYLYVQHDSKGECILKYDDKNASSLVRGVINSAWSVVEDDKALCILWDISERLNQDFKEPVPNKESMFKIDEKNVEESGPNKESMTRMDDNNVKESVPIPKKEVVSKPYWINVKESVLLTRNVFPILGIIRGNEYTPNKYYYHVMKDANEVNQFVESLHGEAMDTVNRIIPGKLKMYGVPDDPQAFYFIVVFGDSKTRSPYGDYTFEIFLKDSFYDIYGIQTDFTGDDRKLIIPKKKSMGIKTNAGNIIFFREKVL
nr:hypothetical protein [Tanacetum cinerariifolium]